MGGTVLVIEDDEQVARVLRKSLRRLGMTVISASQEEAIEVAHIVQLDLVLVGACPPATIRRLRELQPGLRVACSTEEVSPELRLALLAGGTWEILETPLDVARVRDLVA